MRTFLPLALVLVLAPVPAGAQSHDPDIQKVADAYVKAVLAADAKAITALYTEDAVEMPPNMPSIKGRAAIEDYYTKQMAAMKMTAFTLDPVDERVMGDAAYTTGSYRQTITGPDGKAMDVSGKYVTILKRQGDDWKIAYVIYNGDQPPMMMPGMMQHHKGMKKPTM